MIISEDYVKKSEQEMLGLLKALCAIPAPSHHEERRAEFCRDWLARQGAEGVYIDTALNTVYPVNCEDRDDIIVFMAHTDTVFPDLEPMPWREDEDKVYCPGVGDDTACLTVLLTVIRYILENKLTPKRGILFVANACEEGLGNLKGIRKIMSDYEGRISAVYTFDGAYNRVVNCPVGSHRYLVEAETEGGHSFGKFGNKNAIVALSDLIQRLYQVDLPVVGDSQTTYNVGTIEGGTSVNTIAQYAKMLYEYRSDNAQCLQAMKDYFHQQVEEVRSDQVSLKVTAVGERPCMGDVDRQHLENMVQRCQAVCEKYSGQPCRTGKGSTDANIPMSMGVPAICAGAYLGGGAHTREEWVEKASLPVGFQIAGELILDYFTAD